jgi:D-alanyl-D-alanine carboxypeptidase/D-alanyl-D-alanine-endopeptidase (penicillin-binding protein 4)
MACRRAPFAGFATVAAATVMMLSPCGAAAAASSATGPSNLTNQLAAIEDMSRYSQSDWGYAIVDQKSGDVIAAQNDQKMFDPGSTMKTYAVATALRLYGPDYRFKTPVYKEGTVSGGTLTGNLDLVGSGDLTFGLRSQPNGTLYYENLPELDHSYADLGVAGAVEPPGNPLGAIDELAASVRASGITQVDGNVVIDDRLFTPYNGFPDGVISPIWVNENLIDVLAKPGAVGQPASISWRPMTASYMLQNQVKTVAAGESTSVQITEPSPGDLVVVGQIAADSAPFLVVHQIDDPSAFARTAFIEALQQAGVTVSASPTGSNPATLLPPPGSYQPGDMLGEHVSLPLSQYITLIMKVSYNRGADLMTCLAAVKLQSTDCGEGLVAELKTATDFGVSKTSFYPFDGAGSDDHGRTTPAALAGFLQRASSASYGKTLLDSLPILGRDGTLANVLSKSAVAGHAQIKTGNRVVGTAANQLLLLGNSLAGYVETKSGRHVTVMIAVGNVPISSFPEVQAVTTDQAEMVEAIYKDL